MANVKEKNSVQRLLEDYGITSVPVLENPDYGTAFLGLSNDSRAVYDYDYMVEYLIDTQGKLPVDAADTINALFRELENENDAKQPIILLKVNPVKVSGEQIVASGGRIKRI